MKIEIKELTADYVLCAVQTDEVLPKAVLLCNGTPFAEPKLYKTGGDAFVLFHVFCPGELKGPAAEFCIRVTGAEAVSETPCVEIPVFNDDISEMDVSDIRAPFPLPVVRLLKSLDPGVYESGLWDQKTVSTALSDIGRIAVLGGRAAVRPVHEYLLFLREIRRAFEDIIRFFPKMTPGVTDPGRIDSRAVLTTPLEMLAVAHHLYVLKSHGITGNVAEFGCFAGFSTACLSRACRALGMCLDVFDSFEGLPESGASGYAPGDFAVPEEETKANVAAYGAADVVTFHEGWFEDTLGKYDETPVCIFMDVDLEASAKTVMRLLPRMDARTAVFSNECAPDHFMGSDVRPSYGPGEVTGAVASAFSGCNRPMAGKFLTGDTGAFYRRDKGIPVLDIHSIERLTNI